MKKKTVWSGSYRGIGFEIQQFDAILDVHASSWTFYLYICLDQLPDSIKKRFWLRPKKSGLPSGRKFYREYDEPLISGIEFHGGCTWYSKESGFDGFAKVVKIGCDYQHVWDEGQIFSAEGIELEAKKAIDSLHKLIPNIKAWCSWTGKYFDENEMIRLEGYHGNISKEGARLREESMAKRSAVKP